MTEKNQTGPLKVGITGGIGSGKSTVAKIFTILGIPVYVADDEAKRLMHENLLLKNKIRKLFGHDIYDSEGELDRRRLAAIVFNQPDQLKALNALVHPAVQKDVLEWFNTIETPYALEEAAILIESGAYKFMDYIIVVEAPSDIVIQRVMQRDGVEASDVKSRIQNQISADIRREYADFIIHNDGQQALIPQVLKIDKLLRKKAKIRKRSQG